MRIALVGQPNAGKSTIFNSVAGYKTAVSNYPGTTIEFEKSQVRFQGSSFDLVELPGIYSLSSSQEEERRARDFLLQYKPDVIVDVVDASLLGRSLELTLELLELKIPLVLCLNMLDEAKRKGIDIDLEHLQGDLEVPVIGTIASHGVGLSRLFQSVLDTANSRKLGKIIPMSQGIEAVINELVKRILGDVEEDLELPPRLVGLKLLEQDESIEQSVYEKAPQLIPVAKHLREELSKEQGRPSYVVISSERHAQSMNLFEHVAKVKTPEKRAFRDRIDNVLMHPLWGYVFLCLIMLSFFYLVFGLGKWIEEPVLGLFEALSKKLDAMFDRSSLGFIILHGLLQGFAGGIGIVLPYLVPFLVGLAIIEDVGYVPRTAFLMDSLMHRIGLHGKTIIPFVLGYGCTVPAVMGTRILEDPRDRYITALLVNLIPCAARTTIIFALVGFYLGAGYALLFYVLNIFVIALAGRLLLKIHPEVSPGLILEIPPYRVPSIKAVVKKVWFRLREFIVLAWPILIAGSVILSLLDYFNLSQSINAILAPLTSGLLGLPDETGITLVFGVLRKELTIIMLGQALGTGDFASVMTTCQLVVFTVFTLFYIPCLATLAMLRAVIRTRGMLVALFLTTGIATVIALAARLVFCVFF